MKLTYNDAVIKVKEIDLLPFLVKIKRNMKVQNVRTISVANKLFPAKVTLRQTK